MCTFQPGNFTGCGSEGVNRDTKRRNPLNVRAHKWKTTHPLKRMTGPVWRTTAGRVTNGAASEKAR